MVGAGQRRRFLGRTAVAIVGIVDSLRLSLTLIRRRMERRLRRRQRHRLMFRWGHNELAMRADDRLQADVIDARRTPLGPVFDDGSSRPGTQCQTVDYPVVPEDRTD